MFQQMTTMKIQPIAVLMSQQLTMMKAKSSKRLDFFFIWGNIREFGGNLRGPPTAQYSVNGSLFTFLMKSKVSTM
jgi:hypothetical protein